MGRVGVKRYVMNCLTAALSLVALQSASAFAAAKDASATHKYNLLGESVGLVGFDPVSYFPEGGGKPSKGLIGTSVQHDGVTYRFISKENMERFVKNPGKYLPVFGGWCAWAVAELGKRVDVDPESFVIRDGRLYVFYRDGALDTRSLWLKSPDDMIKKAESNWPELSH